MTFAPVRYRGPRRQEALVPNDAKLYSLTELLQTALVIFLENEVLPVELHELDEDNPEQSPIGAMKPNSIERTAGRVLQLYSDSDFNLPEEALEHYAGVMIEACLKTRMEVWSDGEGVDNFISRTIWECLQTLIRMAPSVQEEQQRRMSTLN